MSCFYPKKGFCLGINPETGKKIMKITSFNTQYVISPENFKPIYDYVKVPCGNCLGCKLDYAKQWAIRCCLEASFYDSNYFITLTYDEDHNPRNLIKEDLRKFIKKLRTYLSRENKPEIRFFAAGEYGPTSLRPHFHVIFFNLVLDDLKLYSYTPRGKLYTSNFINQIWNKGNCIIAEVNYKTCNYVARYCMKKFKSNDLKDFGFNREFVLMSRKPGIGYGYYNDNKNEIYKYDRIYFNFGGNNDVPPPKYYDYLLDKVDPEFLKQIKNTRKTMTEINSLNVSLNTTLSNELEYAKVLENTKKSQTKNLVRRI